MNTNQQTSLLLTRKLLVLMASALFIQISRAQDSLQFKHVTYKVKVVKSSFNGTVTGYLSSISDTSIYVSSSPVKFNGYKNTNSRLGSISYNDISSITLRRKGSTGWGLLIGAITGATVGAIAGYSSGDDSKNRILCITCGTAGAKAVGFGTGFGIIAGGIGAIIGAGVHQTFVVKGNKEKFDEFKIKLMASPVKTPETKAVIQNF